MVSALSPAERLAAKIQKDPCRVTATQGLSFGIMKYLVVTLLLLVAPSYAHNGAVAIAVPAEGIVVDGDLSDWPEEAPWYTLGRPLSYFAWPTDQADLHVRFAVGYTEGDALFLAVEVDDESVVLQAADDEPVYFKDFMEVFLEASHAPLSREAFAYGKKTTGGRGVTVARQRKENTWRYEWRFAARAAGEEWRTGETYGFSVLVSDGDFDRSFSQVAWHERAYHPGNSSAPSGDVVLAQSAGRLEGRFIWEGASSHSDYEVVVASDADPSFSVSLHTDTLGRFQARLPVGSYNVRADVGTEPPTVNAEISKTGTTLVDLPVKVSRGRSISSGVGRRTKAGEGRRRGSWTTYDVGDGFPQKTIADIFQDAAGAIWLSHAAFLGGGGITRYDGVHVQRFATEDGLPSDWVYCVRQDRAGDLWIGTDRGVAKYDGETFDSFSRRDGLGADHVLAIHEDPAGTLWLGTENGLRKLVGDRWSSITEFGEFVGEIRAIADGVGGDMWVLSETDLRRLHDGRLEIFPHTEAPLTDMSVHPDGTVWVTRAGEPHISLKDREWRSSHSESDDYRPTVLADRSGAIWFGHAGGRGLVRLDDTRVDTFTTTHGLANTQIYSLAEGRDRVLWVGTVGGGLSRFDPHGFVAYSQKDGLAGDLVFSVLEDSEGVLWCGTNRGLCRFDGTRWQTIDLPGPAQNVVDIFEDRQGNLWFGLRHDDIVRKRGDQWRRFTQEDGLSAGGFDFWGDILEDSRGRIWAGSGGGLAYFDNDHWTDVTDQMQEPDRIAGIHEDIDGRLWFGGSNLHMLDGMNWSMIAGASSPIVSIAKGYGNHHWLGTWDDGLHYTDGESVFAVESDHPLASGRPISLLRDARGIMWIGDWGEGVRQTDGRVVKTLLRPEGLPDNLIQDMSLAKSGTIWIATERGVMGYNSATTAPRVVIRSISADREYRTQRHVELTTDQKFLRFDFNGISLRTQSGRFTYLYRLAGLEQDWQQTEERVVTYSDLPSGDYVFEVQAVDQDLNYSEPATATITVRPPYGTMAVRGGLAVSLAGLVLMSLYAMRRRRDQRRAEQALLQELEEELQEARQMQMGLMPSSPPSISGVSVAGDCRPANHVGGDLFQYFVGTDAISIATADVTGHRMEAAIPVVMFSGILDNQMEQPKSLTDLFQSLNRSLCRSLGDHKFICFTMAQIEDKTLRLASCGNPYPLHFHNGEVTELKVDGYPLGVRDDTQYSVIEAQLHEGDYLVLYSDGIPETINPADEMFGYERTIETVRAACAEGVSSEKLVERLMSKAREFAGERSQEDDMTCVVVKVAG